MMDGRGLSHTGVPEDPTSCENGGVLRMSRRIAAPGSSTILRQCSEATVCIGRVISAIGKMARKCCRLIPSNAS